MAGSKGKGRHVVPSGSSWKVTNGKGAVTSRHRTQAAGIKAGRAQLGKAGGGELSIHNTKGQVRAKDTIKPGNDPRISKG